MLLDAVIDLSRLQDTDEIAQQAEDMGLQGLWTTEIKHDPFLPLGLAVAATTRIQLGTAVALAFTRSPTTMAYTAWDLAGMSEGRFILGLGTQVKAHIERRFSVAWDAPVERLRDYIAAMRAVWQSWRTGERLRYTGQFYTLKLMTPFFSPDPLPYPDPPIFIAGVNKGLCRLAGEVCQGFHVHPFHTTRYLREALLPWIGEGVSASNRRRDDIQVSANVFAIVGHGAERDLAREAMREQLAFYASTPSYRPVMEIHGWGAQGAELGQLAGRGRWSSMPGIISDSMLAEFAVEGNTLEEAALAIVARSAGLLDRFSLYLPFNPGSGPGSGERNQDWRAAASAVNKYNA